MKTHALVRIGGGLAVALAMIAAPLGSVMAQASTRLTPATITSVTFSLSGTVPTVTVNGSGFGKLPKANPSTPVACAAGSTGYDYGPGGLWFSDKSKGWTAGQYKPKQNAGYDCIGLLVSEFTDTQIVFTFGSYYGVYGPLQEGDKWRVHVHGTTASGKAPFGTVAGKVTDASTGKPVAGECVTIVDPASGTVLATAKPTTATGHYSARVFVDPAAVAEFVDCSGGTYALTWSGGAPTRTTATTFGITQGATTTLNQAVEPGVTVSGTVTFGGGPTVFANAPVTVSFADGPDGMADVAAFTVCSDSSGNYTATGLPTGVDLKISVNVAGMPMDFAPGAITCSNTGASFYFGWYAEAGSFASANTINLTSAGQTGVDIDADNLDV